MTKHEHEYGESDYTPWVSDRSGGISMLAGMTDCQSIGIAIPDQIQKFDWRPHVELHGRSDAERPNMGAVITPDTRCSRCDGPFIKGHCITADLAPNMSGVARHTDCDDPKLEQS